MALLALHAITCSSEELVNVQSSLDTNQFDDEEGLKCNDELLKKPYYIERMIEVCEDVVRLGYL